MGKMGAKPGQDGGKTYIHVHVYVYIHHYMCPNISYTLNYVRI